jgi:uncharacterized protein (TIGR02284 family)
MNLPTDKILPLLCDLCAACQESQRQFQAAAEGLKDPMLSRLFLECATQRAEFQRELQSRIRSLGGQSMSLGFTFGAPENERREKSTLVSDDSQTVCAECERGERAVLKAYRQVLQENIDPISRGLTSRHYVGVQAAHDRIKQLRHTAVPDPGHVQLGVSQP